MIGHGFVFQISVDGGVSCSRLDGTTRLSERRHARTGSRQDTSGRTEMGEPVRAKRSRRAKGRLASPRQPHAECRARCASVLHTAPPPRAYPAEKCSPRYCIVFTPGIPASTNALLIGARVQQPLKDSDSAFQFLHALGPAAGLP